MRTRLEHLLLWRESRERWPFYQAFPPLLILAPTLHQRDLWISCAQEAAAHLRVAPCKGASAMLHDESPWRFSWQRLDGSGATSLHSLIDPIIPQAIPPGLLAPRQIEAGTFRNEGQKGKSVVVGHFEARAKQLKMDGVAVTSMAQIGMLTCFGSCMPCPSLRLMNWRRWCAWRRRPSAAISPTCTGFSVWRRWKQDAENGSS